MDNPLSILTILEIDETFLVLGNDIKSYKVSSILALALWHHSSLAFLPDMTCSHHAAPGPGVPMAGVFCRGRELHPVHAPCRVCFWQI